MTPHATWRWQRLAVLLAALLATSVAFAGSAGSPSFRIEAASLGSGTVTAGSARFDLSACIAHEVAGQAASPSFRLNVGCATAFAVAGPLGTPPPPPPPLFIPALSPALLALLAFALIVLANRRRPRKQA